MQDLIQPYNLLQTRSKSDLNDSLQLKGVSSLQIYLRNKETQQTKI